ncbi:MAG: SurA N-terminal domain-containing protein [Gammaproteobacteria bacterium]|nr:SurA N-terminal domain-containing protein [Gammaproteobacteria bacterium]
MLQLIRDWVQGWLAVAIVALLIVPFAFWGINYYFGQSGEVSVARVNGTDITLRGFQRALQSVRQRWQAAGGGALSQDEEASLKAQTLDGLVERELLRQTADEIGLRIGDDHVRKIIESVQAFQGESGFDAALYESHVSLLGLSQTGFEQQVREEMSSAQLQSALVETGFSTENEVRRLAQLRGQSRDFWYSVLSSDAIKEGMVIEEQDIRSYYEKNANLYLLPERIRIAYIELSLDRLAEDVPVDEELLRHYYEENRGSYGVEEQREIRQLLVPTPAGADTEAVDKARSIAGRLAEQIRAGAAMKDLVESRDREGEVALEYSEFGLLSSGILEAPVDEAAFAAQEGEIIGPIQTRFGFHIVQVAAVKGGKIEAFENTRQEVEQDYRKAEAEKLFFELADRLATLAFEHPDSLEPAAEDLDVPIRESELFERGVAGGDVTGDPRIQTAAFSEEVLRDRNNSDVIELDNNRAVVLRVSEHIPEQKPALEDVRDRVITRIKFERARDAMHAKGEEILEKLRSGAPRDGISADYGVEWREARGVQVDDAGINRAILRTAFRVPRPAGEQPEFAGVSLGSGDYAVIALESVAEPAAESLSKEEMDAVRTELRQKRAQETWTRFLADLKTRAEVTMYRENVQ